MKQKELISILSKCLAIIAAIPAANLLGQYIIMIITGRPLPEITGKLFIVLLPSILIWFIAPRIVNRKISNRGAEISTVSVVLLTSGVALSVIAAIEVLMFFMSFFAYQRFTNYELMFAAKGLGAAFLVISAIVVMRKSKA